VGVGLNGRREEEKQLTGKENRNARYYIVFQKPTVRGILKQWLIGFFDSLLEEGSHGVII
jgi:hypothetical protein